MVSLENGVFPEQKEQNLQPLYGFEMSFPAGNPQGVNEEPWHWRCVGEPTARQIF